MAKKQQEELRASKQKETSARRKSKAVAPKQATRVGWLRTVFELNPEVDFLNLDYLPNSADLGEVKFGPLSEEARGLVLQDLKAYQRIKAALADIEDLSL